MRLINDNELMTRLKEEALHRANTGQGHIAEGLLMAIDYIKTQPTAYDIDAVIEQVNKKSLKMSTAKPPHTYMRAIGTQEAEKIIKKGGM